MRGLIRLLIICFACIVNSGCIIECEPEESSLKVGDKVPNFSIIMNDGSRMSTISLLGHKSVIVFFNTSCQDCRRELPRIQTAMEDNPDIRFICIARDECAEDIEQFWQDNNLTLPYSPQPDNKVFNLFASVGIPRVYTVSSELVITGIYVEHLPENMIW